jgi:hypothetical protein
MCFFFFFLGFEGDTLIGSSFFLGGVNIEHSSKLEAQKCSPCVYPQVQLWAKDMGLKCGAIGNILGEQIQNIIENT